MPERSRVEFWVWRAGDCYKMEIAFENIVESVGCCLGGDKVNALILKVTSSSSSSPNCICFLLLGFSRFTVTEIERRIHQNEHAFVKC